MSACFWIDAGADVGGGHVTRVAARRAPNVERATKLIIGFGMSDPAGLTHRALRALVPYSANLDITVLVGGLVLPNIPMAIHDAASQLPTCRIVEDASEPTELLLRVDGGCLALVFSFSKRWPAGCPRCFGIRERLIFSWFAVSSVISLKLLGWTPGMWVKPMLKRGWLN